LTLRETYALNRLSSFKNLRRKGGKFDHRPGRPKVLLRHWIYTVQTDRQSVFCNIMRRSSRSKTYSERSQRRQLYTVLLLFLWLVIRCVLVS